MWFAQEPSPVEFIQYGAIGLVLVGILLGWIWPKPAVDRILKEQDRLRERVDRCEDEVRDELKEVRRMLEQDREPRGRS